MDKCFIFTILLLVHQVAAVSSQDVYKCQISKQTGNKENIDVWFNITLNTICSSTSRNPYLCKCERTNTIVCDTRCISSPDSCADAVTVVRDKPGSTLPTNAVTVVRDKPGSTLPTNAVTVVRDKPGSTLPTSTMGLWSSWSDCITSGEWYRHRSLVCENNQSACVILSNGSSPAISNCTIESARENLKEAEKHYTLIEIILVAVGCFLLGALLSALIFLFYIKRTQQRCFSKHANDAQSNSNQLSGPDLKFLTESISKEYDGHKPKSSHSNKENIAEETDYQSLESNQDGNDQQTYDKLKVKESRYGPQGFHADPSSPKQSGDFVQTDHIANFQNKTEGAYEYSLDSDGYNYFILEGKALQEKIIPGMWNVQKPHVVVCDEANCMTLETKDNQYDAAHDYFVLEHLENGQNHD